MSDLKDSDSPFIQKPATPSAPSRTFLQNTLALLTGSGAAQIMRVVMVPIIARLFPPAALGIAQTFSAIGKTSAVAATLRYEDSIQLPESDEDALRQLLITLLFTAGNSIVLIGVAFFLRTPISQFLNAPPLERLLLWLPLFVFLRGSFLALREWHIRQQHYTRIASAIAAESILWDASALGFGLAGHASSAALAGAQMIGQAAASGMIAFPALRILKQVSFTRQDLAEGMRQFRKFPLFNTWSKLLDNAALYVPVFLFSAFFSPEIAGQFTLSFNMLQLPFSMAASAAGQVLYQQASAVNRQHNLGSTLAALLSAGSKAAVLPVILISIAGDEIVKAIFGANWALAGQYAQILSPWMMFIFLSIMIERIPAVLGKNEYLLVFHGLNALARTVALLVGSAQGNPTISVIALSISGCLIYGVYILAVGSVSGLPLKNAIRAIALGLVPAIPATIGIAALRFLIAWPTSIRPIAMLIASAAISAIYYGFLISSEPELRSLILKFVKKSRKG